MSVLDQFRLDGKVALVTGCRRGIGKAMAIALAEAGADIAGVSANLEARGSDIEREVLVLGRRFKPYTCDFSDRKALYRFIALVRADFPVIDILVNNAGTILRKPAAEHPDEYWDRIITGTTPLEGMEPALRQMESGGEVMKILVRCAED